MGKKGKREKQERESTSAGSAFEDAVLKLLCCLALAYLLLAGGFDWVAFFKPTTTGVTLLRGSGDVTPSSSSPPLKAVGTNPDDGGVIPSRVEEGGEPKLSGGYIFPNLIEGENSRSIVT